MAPDDIPGNNIPVEEISADIVFQRLDVLLTFPLDHPELVPSLIPIFLGLFIRHRYFGRHRDEMLGWNSAVSNAVLLIAASLTLIYTLGLFPPVGLPRHIVAYSIFAAGVLIVVLNYYHLWPAFIAFKLSSSTFSHTLAYIAIAWVYAGLPLDPNTAVAALSLFVGLVTVFQGIKYL